MKARFLGDWRVTAICSFCGAETFASEVRAYPGMEIYNPALPAGWMQIDELTICPKHKVQVLVDDKIIGL